MKHSSVPSWWVLCLILIYDCLYILRPSERERERLQCPISLGSCGGGGGGATHFARVIRLIREVQAYEGKTVDQIQIGSECVSTVLSLGPIYYTTFVWMNFWVILRHALFGSQFLGPSGHTKHC